MLKHASLLATALFPVLAFSASDVIVEGTNDRTIDVSNTNYGTGVYVNTAGIGLEIEGGYTGVISRATASGYENYGLQTTVSGGIATNYGVYSLVSDGNIYLSNYGLYGWASGGTATYNVGVFGYADGGSGATSYAGYFDGDVVITGSCSGCSPSDQKLKKNVQSLDKGLAEVMALAPKSYDMKAEEYKGTITLSKDHQFGLIAQDVEAVLPNLVKEVTAPVRLTENEKKNKVKKEAFKYKTVNYTGLIPIMLKAIQEQQAEITNLKKEVERLSAR